MGTHREVRPSFLGEQIRNRLKQLGISRRDLARVTGLSRQTLHHLEYDSGRGFALSTFKAIDKGLKWPKGTAEAYYRGIADARDQLEGFTTEERVENYLGAILAHLATMNVDELEREVLLLEAEAYGREGLPSADALVTIRESITRLGRKMSNGKEFQRVARDDG
jgi:transcriptional regulator with XRE-family HTH domain